MREIIFIKDFANKKKGDSTKCDGQLASHLVRVAKVAKYADTAEKSDKTIVDKIKDGIKEITGNN